MHHRLKVIHSYNMYRHLELRDDTPNWYDIITWPDALVIHGEMGTFMFHRHDHYDMLESMSKENPPSHYANWLGHPKPDVRGVLSREKLRDALIDATSEFSESAKHEALKIVTKSMSANDAWILISQWSYAGRNLENFESTYEICEYSPHFLWCLEAIKHAAITFRESS